MMIVLGILIIFFLIGAIYMKKSGYVDPWQMQQEGNDKMLKFLATTYLTNNDFMKDKTVLNLLEKFNITYEEVIKYAEEHRDELINNQDNQKEE